MSHDDDVRDSAASPSASSAEWWAAWQEPPSFLGPFDEHALAMASEGSLRHDSLHPLVFTGLGLGLGIALAGLVLVQLLSRTLRAVEQLGAAPTESSNEPPAAETRR